MKNSRTKIVILLILIANCALIYRASILMLGQEHKDMVNLTLMNRSPVSLRELNDHVVKLKEMTNDIEAYSFLRIKRTIEGTINLINLTNNEIEAQYNAWINVQGKIDNDKESYLELRSKLDLIQQLQGKEILHLKNMLEEAAKPSPLDNFFNLMFTFILGILSSILATMGWTTWKNRNGKL